MIRTVAHVLAVLAIVAVAGLPSYAQDYQCRKVSGCVARKPVNGTLQTVKFRKGDLVSTEDGWVVNPDEGWKKVRSKTFNNI